MPGKASECRLGGLLPAGSRPPANAPLLTVPADHACCPCPLNLPAGLDWVPELLCVVGRSCRQQQHLPGCALGGLLVGSVAVPGSACALLFLSFPKENALLMCNSPCLRNSFTGPIPEEWAAPDAKWTELAKVYLTNNSLSGPVPYFTKVRPSCLSQCACIPAQGTGRRGCRIHLPCLQPAWLLHRQY